MFLKYLAVFYLAIITASALPVLDDTSYEVLPEIEEVVYRLPNNTVPTHYDLKIIPYIVENNFTFDGEANIQLKIVTSTSVISLHSRNLTYEISATKLTFENGSVFTPESFSYNIQASILCIHFYKLLDPGKYTLRLKYTGILSDDLYGFYRSSYKNEKGDTVWVVSTQFQPIAARRAFPCWDEPAFKAIFNISIKHYNNCTALSNMPVREKSEVDMNDGKVWTHFEATPIMSTYLVAFVVANYTNISNSDGTVNVWANSEMITSAKFIHDVAQKASLELEKYTNSSVRVPKMDHVVVPEHAAAAMENWGLIIYPTRWFAYKEGYTIMSKIRVATTAAHELAHQWFGNLVSPTWWSHVWLNEGFAAYFENYIIDKIFHDWRIMDSFVVRVLQQSLLWDTYDSDEPIDNYVATPEEIMSSFSKASYEKAPSILRMLAHVVSEKVFRIGLIEYLDARQYNSTNPDCLWMAMQNAMNESDIPHNDFNVKEVMDTWVTQKNYPLITVERDYITGEVRITQKNIGTMAKNYVNDVNREDEIEETEIQKEKRNNTWWVPINYATKSNPDFLNTQPTHWLTPRNNLLIHGVAADDWIIVNKQQTGYYRVNYDSTNWKKLVKYLKEDDFKNIHVLNRAQIVDDIIHLTVLNEISPSLFFEVISYLSRETDYIPWFPVFRFLDDIKEYLIYPEAQRTVKPFVLNMMKNLIEDVGFTERHNDDHVTILKRMKVVKWACIFDHVECKKAAATTLLRHVRDPNKHKISPNLRKWAYCYGLTGANESIWNEVFDTPARDNPSKEVLRYLDCTRNPELLTKYLDLSLNNNSQLSMDERKRIFFTLYRNPANYDVLMDFLLENLGRTYLHTQDPNQIIEGMSKVITRPEQVEKLKKLANICHADKELTAEICNNSLIEVDRIKAELRRWTSALY